MIRSTFAGFNTAQLAMAASQKSLDVVGQNIANINTAGYTRQRLDLQSIGTGGNSYWNSAHSNKIGQGVTMAGVSQIRDPFLDIQYRNQLTSLGTVDAKDVILEDIGEIFDETAREGIREAFNDIVTQLQNMSSAGNAGQDTFDNLLRSSMQVLLNLFHDSAESITSAQEEAVTNLTGTMSGDIQSYLDRIVELNESIKTNQVLGNPALELMDQRNAYLDELATYLPIDVTYVENHIGGDVYVDTLQVTFTDAEGNKHTLIDDTKSGTITIEGTKSGTPEKELPPLTISITGVGEGEEKTVVAEVQEDGKVVNHLVDGVLKGYVDMLNSKGAFDGTNINGIGYYEDYFNALVNEFATTLNELNNIDGGTDNNLFTTSDGSDTFTATNIQISEGWLNGTVKVQNTTTDAESANDNLIKMINALTIENHQIKTGKGEDASIVFDGNFFDIYDNLQNTQAVDRQSASSILENRVTVLNQIANSKDSVSGVYLDEEVMNLMKYQQSYNAAARLMTTLDEALDTLINSTGVVGR